MWRYFLPLGIVAVLVVVFWRGLSLNPSEIPSPLIGKAMPEFDLPALHNPEERFTHADLKGKVSLLNVYGSWCAGCHEEHPLLMMLAKNTDIPVYGLNWKDEREAALAWLNRDGNPYVMSGFDEKGNVGIDWGVYGAPETFLVDQQGIIRYKRVGILTQDIIEQEILPLVRELRGQNALAGDMQR